MIDIEHPILDFQYSSLQLKKGRTYFNIEMGDKKPYLAVFLIQTLYVVMFLISKAAFNGGLKSSIFVFYRQVGGTAVLLPLAMILERKNAPPLSFVTFCKIFMLALIGITISLNLAGFALVYTSPTLTAASMNVLPVATFIFAFLLRLETVKLRTIPGMAKLAGVIAGIAGVAILAFYKGPHFGPLFHFHLSGYNPGEEHHQTHVSSGEKWIKGCFLAFLSTSLWGLWLVLQAQVLKSYPSKLMFTSLQCLLSVFQSFAVAIALERDPNQWKLGWNTGLLAVAYCGIVVTAVTFYVQAWVIEKKGPVFQAMSTPLSFVMTLLCSTFLLGEVVTLGSVLGGIVLVGSLYSVLWAKSKEQNVNQSSCLPTEAEQGRKDVKEEIKATFLIKSSNV